MTADSLRGRIRSRRATRPGWVDPITGTMRATPWHARTEDGLYLAPDGDGWLYHVLPNASLRFTDDSELLDHGHRLEALLAELGSTSIRQPTWAAGMAADLYRSIHIVAVRHHGPVVAPAQTPTAALKTYLDGLLRFEAPTLTVMVGIRLRTVDATRVSRSGGSLTGFLGGISDGLFGDRPVGIERFEPDLRWLRPVMARAGCRPPTGQERRQLEAWWNGGRHTEPEVRAWPDRLHINDQQLEFSAVAGFHQPVMTAPWQPWIATMLDHPDAPACVSIRAELQPAADTRRQLRRVLARQDLEQQEAWKERGGQRREEAEAAGLARHAEQELSSTDAAATLQATSIVVGRLADLAAEPPTETYQDHLSAAYAIDVKPLVHRQMGALEEVQPCGRTRAVAFPQALMPSMVGHAGLAVHTAVGDQAGALLGRGVPDGVPIWWDPAASARANVAPGFGIFGTPGSGKTLAALHLCYQAALAGQHAIFINPQVGHTMMATGRYLASRGIQVEHVSLTRLLAEGASGLYDPFRYSPTAEAAAALASSYLTTILDLDQRQRTALRAGLGRGARAGATSVGQALDMVDDAEVVELVRETAASTPLVALAIGEGAIEPVTDHGVVDGQGRFTLVELDMDLGLPSTVRQVYSDSERIGIATVAAIATASVGMLTRQNGGVLMIDEAHTLLHGETIRQIDKLLREGRKLNVVLGLITQQARDVLDAGMETYLSRVLALRMTDERDAAATLRLVGYDPTPDRIAQMRQFGARQRADGTWDPALGYYRDVTDRKALISVGPIDPEFLAATSTNIDDEARRRDGMVAAAANGGAQ